MANLVSPAEVQPLASTPARGAQKPPASAERLLSLDTFRGFTMFWIVGGEALMLGIQHLGHNRVIDLIVRQLNHTPWIGLRFEDCIWPSFMLMV